MAEATLHSLRTNAARLGARLGENLAEHSRDLGLIDSFASGSGGGSGKYLENGVVLTAAGIEETKKMLISKRESDRLEGLKRVIAMMTKNLPVTSFFPLVTSLLSPSTPLQARTLISLYIVHCAAVSPELALLSINAYQKDLSDPNPLVRAGAIKTLAAMNLDDIRSLVGVAITRAARDTSWYVRRATADAVIALWRADSSPYNQSQLVPTLEILLDTSSPLTVGSAIAAWEEVCPTRWDLIHRGYRRWVKMLMDVEEWGQCVLLRVLLRYGRTFFLDPASTGKLDPDVELLLESSEALLQHLNPAVVSAVIKVHYYLGLPERHFKVVRPLLRLLKTAPPEVQAVVLDDCAVLAGQRPDLFADHLTQFFVRFSHSPADKLARLHILVALSNHSNIQIVLGELMVYVKDSDETFSSEAITAIGVCAQRVPKVLGECIQTLIRLAQRSSDAVVAQSILVLRSLLSSATLSNSKTRPAIIIRLVELLRENKISTPVARSTVYWLVGQYADEGLLETVGPDTVRLGAKGFANESDAAKLQIVTLSAKLLVLSHSAPLTPNLHVLSQLFNYLTTLARYDTTYEVRDRARFLKGLISAGQVGQGHDGARLALGEEEFKRGVQVEDLSGSSGTPDHIEDSGQSLTTEQVRSVLFDGKVEVVQDTNEAAGVLGSLSLSLPNKRLLFNSSSALPAYPSTVPPSSIRDVAVPERGSQATATPSPVPMRGFGSDDLARAGAGSSRASPVVLVPTNFSATSGDGTTPSRSDSPASFGARGTNGRRNGFRDLDDFYADDDESESDDEDEDEEEDEEESEVEEDDSGSEEQETSGDDEDATEEDEDQVDDENVTTRNRR